MRGHTHFICGLLVREFFGGKRKIAKSHRQNLPRTPSQRGEPSVTGPYPNAFTYSVEREGKKESE